MGEGMEVRTKTAAARRGVTPAVLASGLFALVCAVVSVGFVAARGGLLFASPSASIVAVASPVPTATPSGGPTDAPTSGPSAEPSAEPTGTPTPTESSAPTGPSDPLLALPGCPGYPGCYEYTVARGDSLTLISDRFDVFVSVIREFNPQVAANGDVVRLGDVLRLGRSRYVILDPCPDLAGCWLYVVKSGDTLSGIAQRYGLTVDALRADNPSLSNGLRSGMTIRLIPPA